MKRLLLSLSALTVLTLGLNAQVTFHNVYQGLNEESGVKSKQTQDGGYVIVGTSGNSMSGTSSILLLKIDVNGVQTWAKTVSASSLQLYATSVIQTADLGYAISGHVGSGSEHLVIKTDMAGNVLWTYRYGASSTDRTFDLVEASNGDIVVCGDTWDVSVGGLNAFLMRLSSAGVYIWSKVYGVNSISEYEVANGVDPTSDGGFIITGYADEVGTGGDDIMLIKTNSLGDTLWTRTYGGPLDDVGHSVQQTSDGGYIVAGGTRSFGSGQDDAILIKTDATGNVQWAKTYGNTSNDVGRSVTESTNGGYILGGTFSYGAPIWTSYMYGVRTNSVGDTLWTRRYGGTKSDTGNDLGQASDGGYFVTGTTLTFAPGTLNTDLYFVKTDTSGFSGVCYEGSTPTQVSSPTLNVGYTTVNVSVQGLPVAFTHSSGNASIATWALTNISSNASAASTLCNGDNTGYAWALGSGGLGGYTYQWSDPLSQTGDTAVTLFAGGYTVTVSDTGGCSIVDTVVVAEPTAISIAMSAVDTTCPGANTTLTTTPSGGTGPYTYGWTPTDSLACTNCATTAANPSATTTYQVMVTDNNGCLDSASVTVEVSTADQVPICLITVDSTSSHNLLVWEKPATSNIVQFNIYRDIIGTYTFIGSVPYDSLSEFKDTTNGINPNVTSYRYVISTVDTCGNESDTSAFHETIHLSINIGAGNDINLIWDNYEGFPFSFYYILRDTIGGGNYVVFDSVSTSSTQLTDPNGQLFAYVDYLIQVVPPATCSSTRAANYNSSRSNRAQGAAPGMSEFGTAEGLTIYPNPNNGSFTLNLQGLTNGTAQVFDVTGKLVWQQPITSSQTAIDLQDAAPGLYHVKVITWHTTRLARVVVR